MKTVDTEKIRRDDYIDQHSENSPADSVLINSAKALINGVNILTVSVKDLIFKRGSFQIDIPSFEIDYGEKIALLGENGCGKTTLLQILLGLLKPTSGVVLANGVDISTHSYASRANLLSYLPQEAELLFDLNVRDILSLTVHSTSLVSEVEQINVLKALELENFLDRRYHTLSGGERRRVMLARVLYRDSLFTLLDEPTAPLDLRHTFHCMHYIGSRCGGVLTAIHDINIAAKYFERFILMKGGKIIYDVNRESLNEKLLTEVYDVRIKRCCDHFVICGDNVSTAQ